MKLLDEGLWVPDNDDYFTSGFEKLVTKRAMKHARQGGTFLDVGAHIGLWSMRLSKLYKQVYAVEPVSDHFNCLTHNTIALENVTCLERGAGNSTEDVEMKVGDHNSGKATMNFRNRKDMVTETVKVRKLDDIIPGPFEDIDFIKMDVEGNEVKALLGARKILTTSSPDIFVEVNRQELHREYNALHLLDDLGYKVLYTAGCNYFLRREHPRPKEV